MTAPATWGIVSTIKAPTEAILEFVAHHLDLGAQRIYIHLDDENPEAFAALKPHPKLRVTRTDAAYWQRLTGKRPLKHQPRQTANATRTYARCDVDWLAHIDVDEFLLPVAPLADQLAALPPTCQTARIRPIEALASIDPTDQNTWFKSCRDTPALRREDSDALYPLYGPYLNGGFLSHVLGKIFVRTGIPDLTFRIHHAFLGEVTNPNQHELTGTKLAHFHAGSWENWYAHYRYRHAKGSYRDEMKPAIPAARGGLNLHRFFAEIEASEGVDGLRRFFDTVCLASPEHCEKLRARGLLGQHRLDLAQKRRAHFP